MKFSLPCGTLVHIYIGDITNITADAVVNTGNTTLSNKRGLNKIVLDCAGKSVVNEIKRKINSMPGKKLNFGDVLVTSSGKLNCKNIIHTVSVTFKNPSNSNKSAVQKVVEVCLKEAEANNFSTLVFPAIGTGLSCFRYSECTEAYVNVLKCWKSPCPKEIHFVIKSKKLLEQIQSAFNCHFSHLATAASRSRKKASPGVAKTPTTKPSAVTSKLQTNHTEMAIDTGATASQVAPTPAVTSDSSDSCPICLSDFTDRKTLDKCGHQFCSACIDHSFSAVGPYCPLCLTVYGKVIGLQPPGMMMVEKEMYSLPGFPECQHYKVHYEIPSGTQEKGHPNPGRSFIGAKRTAYLPSNEEGVIVLKMLQRAFKQKLIFTVGDSRTSNMTDVVTWNDIHHKTKIMGGPSRFGYPDQNYLRRVTLELEAKGITPADVFDQKIISRILN